MGNDLIFIPYTRKSSDESNKQLQSLETQKHILSEIINREKLRCLPFLAESKSARFGGKRPLFKEMCERIKRGEANAILCVHADRLARNLKDAGELEELFDYGLLKAIKTPYTLIDSVQSFISIRFEFANSSHMPRDLSIKVKAGIKTKLRNGEYPSYALIGYVNNLRNKRMYVCPKRGHFITQLFSLFATADYSLSQITKTMYNLGFRSRRGYRLSKSTIHRILTNPEYYGMIRRYGKLYAGKHKPLTTKATFDKVQAILQGKKVKGIHKLSFLYRGYLICAVCGCMFTATTKKHVYDYYYCTNGKGICDQHQAYLGSAKVRDLLTHLMADFSLPGDLAKASLDLYGQELLRKSKDQDYISQALTKDLEVTEGKLGKLEDMLLDERISKDRYDMKRNGLLNQLTDIKEQLSQCPRIDTDHTLELLENIKDQAVNLGDMFKYGDDEVRSDLLKSVLWNCSLMDGKIISTRYKKPFVYLEGLSKETDLNKWR